VVVYVAAEGVAGLSPRIRAWKHTHGVEGAAGVSFITTAANVMDKSDCDALLNALTKLPQPPALIVIDTLARCLIGGDENSAKDIGLAIAGIDRLRTALRCAALLVHHSGKNSDTERGSSALRGAADTMLALSKDGNGIVLRCDKDKNAAVFADMKLKLVVVDLNGCESSCVLALGVPPVNQLAGTRLVVLRKLVELFASTGATYTELEKTGIPGTSLRRALADLEVAGYVRAPEPPGSRGGKYAATTDGIAAFQHVTANGHGGELLETSQRFSADRHSPPVDRRGGDHNSPPPATPPYRGGGVAVGGVPGNEVEADAVAEHPDDQRHEGQHHVDGPGLLAVVRHEHRCRCGRQLKCTEPACAGKDILCVCCKLDDIEAHRGGGRRGRGPA
jgi:hypothetical protein